MPIAEISSLTSQLALGNMQVFRNLAVVPLLDPWARPAGCLTLDEALQRGLTEVTEVSESGSVPHLKLINRSPDSVFLLDGEELVGAKQNRILNLSILVPGQTELEIPVSCVEQGRWDWRARGFSGSERMIYSKLRRSNAESVSDSLANAGVRSGNQGNVWNDIAAKSHRMSVHSDTSAASALFERYGKELDEFVSGIVPVPGQIGAAFLVGDRFAGLDVLAGPDLLARLLAKLVRSYALDALDDDQAGVTRPAASISGARAVHAALDGITRMTAARHPAIGRGEDLRLKGESLIGSALIAAGSMIHLGVWAAAYH
jgi:hypothetical protein